MIEFNILDNQIKEIELFKSKLEKTQLIYPVDAPSLDLIQDQVVIKPIQYDFVQLSIAAPFEEAFEVKIGSKKYYLAATIQIALA